MNPMLPASTFARPLLSALAILCLFPGCQRSVTVTDSAADPAAEQRNADYASLAYQIIRLKQQTELNTCYNVISSALPDLRVWSITPTTGGSGLSSSDANMQNTYMITLSRPVSESEYNTLAGEVKDRLNFTGFRPNLDDSIGHWQESVEVTPYAAVLASWPPAPPTTNSSSP